MELFELFHFDKIETGKAWMRFYFNHYIINVLKLLTKSFT